MLMSHQKTNLAEYEDEIRRGLERVLRLERLRGLNAPDEIIRDGERLVSESEADLGPDLWAEVLRRAPRYAEFREAREKKERAWDDRCKACSHWAGYDPAEAAIDNLGAGQEGNLDAIPWCQKYSIVKITRPQPCPDFDALD